MCEIKNIKKDKSMSNSIYKIYKVLFTRSVINILGILLGYKN